VPPARFTVSTGPDIINGGRGVAAFLDRAGKPPLSDRLGFYFFALHRIFYPLRFALS
jgi:hypothetical protein